MKVLWTLKRPNVYHFIKRMYHSSDCVFMIYGPILSE